MTTPTQEELDAAYRILGLPVGDEAARLDAETNQRIIANEATELALAAQASVDAGERTFASAAATLYAIGSPAALMAHTALVQHWQALEAAERVEERAWELENATADEYVDHIQSLQWAETAEVETKLEEATEEIGRRQLEGLTRAYRDYIQNVPGAHLDAERLGGRLRQHVIETESVPDTGSEKARLVAEKARELSIADGLNESLQEQVNTEWRILRKERGSKDGAMTAHDLARAEQAYKSSRFAELAETTLVPAETLALPATPEELSRRDVERIGARNEKEQAFHNEVHAIAERGVLPGQRDLGASHTDDKARYRAAVKAAEETATYGAPRTAADVVDAPKTGALDEYGDAFGIRA